MDSRPGVQVGHVDSNRCYVPDNWQHEAGGRHDWRRCTEHEACSICGQPSDRDGRPHAGLHVPQVYKCDREE
jgi:hypothetical protein